MAIKKTIYLPGCLFIIMVFKSIWSTFEKKKEYIFVCLGIIKILKVAFWNSKSVDGVYNYTIINSGPFHTPFFFFFIGMYVKIFLPIYQLSIKQTSSESRLNKK